jgi:hypothetical protein
MPVVPSKYVEKIQFFESRMAHWAEDAAEIGTTPEAVAQLDTLTGAGRAAYDAQLQAMAAAKAATATFLRTVDEMAKAGANIISQIRVKASTDGDDVYPKAYIPAPAKPSPIAAPGMPDQFSFELSQVGPLTLKWKCKNPKGSVGTMYQVWRRIGTGELTYLGGVGVKKFVDDTLPAAVSDVMYQVQAVRSTKAGPMGQFNVHFGTGNGVKVGAFIPKSQAA